MWLFDWFVSLFSFHRDEEVVQEQPFEIYMMYNPFDNMFCHDSRADNDY